MNKKIPALLLAISFFAIQSSKAQLNISGAQFVIESGAEVTVQGDLTSTTDILGPGKIILNGTSLQNVNTGGFTIPNLEMDNNANAILTGNTRIGNSLLFTNGKIFAGDFNLNLADTAEASGMGAGKFVETNGTGQVIKELIANVTSVEIPVGAGTEYRPAFVTTAGTYSNAKVGLKVLPAADPSAPPSLSDYIKVYWPVTRTGITGSVTVEGQYANADINTGGRKDSVRGYFNDGTDWSSATETHNASTNRVAASISANGTLSGMDKFDLLNTKVFLQGAYNTSSGLMSDALRTPTNLIPLTDPYRTAAYSPNFTHVANVINEAANATVFVDKGLPDNNIVDWVFLELRSNVSPGNIVLQTRSALLKRNGNIVDVDGTSAVTFNNVANGNYTIAVRHRNHLGISTDPATNLKALAETKSSATMLDFTTAAESNIYGPATAYGVSINGKNVMWAGNANSNANVKYIGLSNDKDFIGVTTLGNNASRVLSDVYNPADVNMNRSVRFLGLANDKDLILINALSNNASTQRIQSLPN